jgi:hypothetical protein
MGSCRLVPLALAAAAACAGVSAPPGPPGPPPFEGVKTIALVRLGADGGGTRPKDPLDALEESLRARGYATRVVELGRRPPDALRPVQRLHDRVGSRASSGQRSGRVERAGAEAEAAATALGVDAIALYHRSADLGVPLPSDPRPFPTPGYPPPTALLRRPLGALSLVDARGNAVTFEWGAGGEPAVGDSAAPVNAAEAIEALLRVLASDPADAD